jgi:hypothetical protein
MVFAAALFALMATATSAEAVLGEAPTISLDLAAMPSLPLYKHVMGSAESPAARAVAHTTAEPLRAHNPAYSVSKFAKTCAALPWNDPSTVNPECKLPHARAYDHHDGVVAVHTSLYLTNKDGNPMVQEKCNNCGDDKARTFIDWHARSEYLLKFNAADDSGNKAETVIFALVINDLIAPVIKPSPNLMAGTHVLEACDRDNTNQESDDPQYWLVPTDNQAVDNVDGDISKSIDIQVVGKHSAPMYQQGNLNLQNNKVRIDTHILGPSTKIYLNAKDNAGIFGKNGKDNMATWMTQLVVKDTVAPTIYCKKSGCKRASDGKFQAGTTIASLSNIRSFEDCCDKCEQQQWNRAVGSKSQPAMCTHFAFSAKTAACKLIQGSKDTANRISEGDFVGGYPIQCQSLNVQECKRGAEKAETTIPKSLGARCIDFHDSLVSLKGTAKFMFDDSALKVTSDWKDSKDLNLGIIGTYDLEYNCKDASANQAKPVSRGVSVVDTTVPVISQIPAGYETSVCLKNANKMLPKLLADGTCSDTCTVTSKLTQTQKLYPETCPGDWRVLNETTGESWTTTGKPSTAITTITGVGTYGVKYTCADESGNDALARCTHLVVTPNEKPTITVAGDKEIRYITKGKYECDGNCDCKERRKKEVFKTCEDGQTHQPDGTPCDQGATCGDCHGNAFPVHITGMSDVDLSKPGAYTVYFNCENTKVGEQHTDEASCTDAGYDWVDDGHCAHMHEANTKDEVVPSWQFCPKGSFEEGEHCIKDGLSVSTLKAACFAKGFTYTKYDIYGKYVAAGAERCMHRPRETKASCEKKFGGKGTWIEPRPAYCALTARERRRVVVTERPCPFASLIGNPKPEQEAGFPFIDHGACFWDVVDGRLDNKGVTVYGDVVNIHKLGKYTLKYTYARSAVPTNSLLNCKAMPVVSREVKVIDTLRPVISLDYNGKTFHTGAHNDKSKALRGHPRAYSNPAGLAGHQNIMQYDSSTELGAAPWLNSGAQDNNGKAWTAKTCQTKCGSMPTCKYGTFVSAGVRAGECWLSAGTSSFHTPCGVPCKSFFKVQKQTKAQKTADFNAEQHDLRVKASNAAHDTKTLKPAKKV